MGYSDRVAKMFTVFEQVNHGQYRRDAVVKNVSPSPAKSPLNKSKYPLPVIAFNANGSPMPKGEVIVVQGFIRLERVPVVTPNCDIVVPSLSFTVCTL